MQIGMFLFLVATFFAILFNTAFIWAAYKGFGTVTEKLTVTVREFERRNSVRGHLESLRIASEQAVAVTEVTKQKISEFDPKLENLQARYGFMLAQVDARMERLALGISENASRVRDTVSDPAEKFAATAAGIKTVLSMVTPETEEDDRESYG
jgi:hypothetical protein